MDGEGRERASKLGIAFSKMRGPRAVDGIRRLLKIPRMKLKHPVYESIKGATDAKPKAVSKASELASVDAERDPIPYGLCYRFKLPYFP